MFTTMLTLCAASLMGEVDYDNCVGLEDTYGPYQTKAECVTRAEEMLTEIKTNQLTATFVGSQLGFPPNIHFSYTCESPGVDV